MPVITVLAAVLLCRVPFAEGGSQEMKNRAHLLLKIPEQPGVVAPHQPTSVQSPFPIEDDLAAAAVQQVGRSRSSSQQHLRKHAVDAHSGWATAKRQPEQGARIWPTRIYRHGSKPVTQPQLMTREFRASPCRSGGDNCGPIRERRKCTPDGCLWCANKYSPWAGSDGACVSTEQAEYLPDITYRCERVESTVAITLTA